MDENIISLIAKELNISILQVKNTLELLEEGATVPFIARYRKESTKGLDEEQIRVIQENYAYQVNLAKRKEEVDLKNEVDQAIFATEKTIKETEGKGFDTERDAAKTALDDLKKAQESGNTDDMKAKLETLNEKAQALAVKLYEQAAAAQQAAGGDQTADANDAGSKDSGDDVVDGEFTEK